MLQVLTQPHAPAAFHYSIHTSTPEIYTLSLHDALPISQAEASFWPQVAHSGHARFPRQCLRGYCQAFDRSPHVQRESDRKSTRLNSSHRCISYAVFCLKKKKK